MKWREMGIEETRNHHSCRTLQRQQRVFFLQAAGNACSKGQGSLHIAATRGTFIHAKVHNGISLVTLKICWDSMYDPQYLPCPPLLPFFVPKREAYEMERVSCLVQTGSPALSFQPQGTRHFYPMGQKRDYLRKSEPFSSSGNIHKHHWVALLQNQQELQPPKEKGNTFNRSG